MINIKMLLIMTFMGLAVINDLYDYKVRNAITFTFAAMGIAYNIAFYSFQNLSFAVLGLIAPLVILLPLYATKMLGAGDIKLFCSIGAFVGVKLILLSVAYSFLAGAIIALFIMLIRKNAHQRFRYFFSYIKCCFLCMAVMPYSDMTVKNDGTKMHFTIPIAIGTMLVLIV